MCPTGPVSLPNCIYLGWRPVHEVLWLWLCQQEVQQWINTTGAGCFSLGTAMNWRFTSRIEGSNSGLDSQEWYAEERAGYMAQGFFSCSWIYLSFNFLLFLSFFYSALLGSFWKIVSVCIFWKRFINKWMYLTYMIAPKLIQRGSQPANAN
jgi:hypothetical protein